MADAEQIEQLYDILGRFYEMGQGLGWATNTPPFDITRPTIHQNKSEFVLEKDAVSNALAATEHLNDFLLKPYRKDDSPLAPAVKRICDAVDDGAARDISKSKAETVIEHIGKTASEQGQSMSLLVVVTTFMIQLRKRKLELDQQEVEFWSDKHRPPNHYARVIALRFAKLIAANSGKRPTFGIAREGDHPSTDYGRALQEVYEILGIKADVRRAAEWALSNLTDADLEAPGPTLGELIGSNPPSGREALVKALMARSTPLQDADEGSLD